MRKLTGSYCISAGVNMTRTLSLGFTFPTT